jgi:hypothetical protein
VPPIVHLNLKQIKKEAKKTESSSSSDEEEDSEREELKNQLESSESDDDDSSYLKSGRGDIDHTYNPYSFKKLEQAIFKKPVANKPASHQP